MDPVQHPLDWWAYGRYAEVVRQTGWSLPKARRQVRKTMKRSGWQPCGYASYEAMRRAMMEPGAAIPTHPHPFSEFAAMEAGRAMFVTAEGPAAQVIPRGRQG
jgi:hypothetical protein